MIKRWQVVTGVAALLLVSAEGADAQRRGRDDFRRDRAPMPAAWVGLSLVAADPVGEFGQLVDAGFGVALEGHIPVTRNGALGLMMDAGIIVYGHERARICFNPPVGCRIDLDLNTSNNIVYMGFGPELAVPTGPIRPYVNATAGFSYFFTHSSLEGEYDDDFGGTNNYDDFVGSLTLGGGMRAEIKGGRSPIVLDFGLQYHRNGVADYLREGDIVDSNFTSYNVGSYCFCYSNYSSCSSVSIIFISFPLYRS